jgi:phosphate transport system substrate-binding protein
MNITRRLALFSASASALMFGPKMALANQVSLIETGSSLLYPLFNLWVPAYSKQNHNVRITTTSTGSGTGIAQALAGVAQIGASDAYLSNPEMHRHPGILNIPLAISAQTVNYNIPGLNNKNINLSGPIIAGIYSGTITFWDDLKIVKVNPGISLPHRKIIPIHRTDGSGDTFIFSQYLTFSTSSWASSVGYGTTISWPANAGGVGAIGNPGMVQAVAAIPYSIAYIGVSFHAEIAANHLGTAKLKNRAGNYVLPTSETVNYAASALDHQTPTDERISLIFAPGNNSYPIINYEYAIVNSRQRNSAIAEELKKFLSWAISSNGGNSPKFLNAVHFLPLPNSIVKLSQDQIQKIEG